MAPEKTRRPGQLQGTEERLCRRRQRYRARLRRSKDEGGLLNHSPTSGPREAISGEHGQCRATNDAGGGEHESRHGVGFRARRGGAGVKKTISSARAAAALMGGTDRPCAELAQGQAAASCLGFCPYGSLRSTKVET